MKPTESHRVVISKWKDYLLGMLLATSLVVPLPCLAQDAGVNDDAQQVVSGFHDQLLGVMRDAKTLGYQGRYDKLHPSITSLFDTPTIAKVILSRYWKEINDQEKEEFIKLFNELSTATYASRFDGYNGESFANLGSEELNKGRLLVKTELQQPGDEPVRMDYLMQRTKEGWRIISVIADGVNDLSLKRAEYAVIIREKGFSGLVEEIRKKIADSKTSSD
ncbi:MAG TPA: ABC transporter substrate-binding protein [Gammaproteobacteria bacterium]|nr:ABC transporter substrate-binding protein [Gammaproteobacteria bacterium]